MRRQALTVLAVTVLALLAFTARAQSSREGAARPAVARAMFEATEKTEPGALARVDNGDGTWSYALPEGFDPQSRVQGRIVTWRYVGQARFSRDPEPVRGMREWVASEERDVTLEEQVRGMKRIDRWGRVWRAERIDRRAFQAVLDEANRDSPENEDEPVGKEREDEPSPKPGTKVQWWPQSWTHSNCDGAGGPVNETHLWDGEGRSAINSGHTARQSTAVRVLNATGSCSGVILKQKQVLTAAHCVSDNSNNPVAVGTVTVCRDDVAGACITAADIDFSGSYGGGSSSGGGTDFADDWAIIELDTTWAVAGFGTAEEMDLSQAGDGTLDALTNVHNLGFPGFAPNCASAGGSTLFHNQEFEPIAATKNKKLKLKIDTTLGHSGGPYYYCPTADNNICAGGEKGFVFGVHAGWNSVDDRAVGPKVAFFRSAALVFIND